MLSDEQEDEAIQLCNEQIRKHDLSAEDRAVLHFKRGEAHYENNEHAKSIADYTRAIDLGHATPSAYSNRGISYSEIDEYDNAIADLCRAIELAKPAKNNSLLSALYSNKGSMYFIIGDHEQAIEDYTEAIELAKADQSHEPNLVLSLIYTNRAAIYSKIGEYDKALGDYDKAIDLNPDTPVKHQSGMDIYA